MNANSLVTPEVCLLSQIDSKAASKLQSVQLHMKFIHGQIDGKH